MQVFFALSAFNGLLKEFLSTATIDTLLDNPLVYLLVIYPLGIITFGFVLLIQAILQLLNSLVYLKSHSPSENQYVHYTFEDNSK